MLGSLCNAHLGLLLADICTACSQAHSHSQAPEKKLRTVKKVLEAGGMTQQGVPCFIMIQCQMMCALLLVPLGLVCLQLSEQKAGDASSYQTQGQGKLLHFGRSMAVSRLIGHGLCQ